MTTREIQQLTALFTLLGTAAWAISMVKRAAR